MTVHEAGAGTASIRAGELTGRPAQAAVIGPNAVTHLAEALADIEGAEACTAVFRAAGLVHRLARPPDAMVPKVEVSALHLALHDALGFARAVAVARRAGELTATYLLAHRIPAAAQALLRRLPRRLAARLMLMLKAIGRHAWTFAGAGTFACQPGRPAILTVRGGPVAGHLHTQEPACAYYAATFQGVFRAVLGPSASVIETECEAQGAPRCRFELSW